MRWFKFYFSFFITIALCLALHHRWGEVPPIAKFLNPFSGCWANADAVRLSKPVEQIHLNGLKGKVTVLMDENHIPHVIADNEADLFFVQGYLTAKDRLWQMELQTHAAAGRVSEIIGEKGLEFDRTQRRKGMVFAAENALQELMKNEITKMMAQQYCNGINAYIDDLNEKKLPLEYKLLNYEPEHWTTLKTALLLKLMADDLSGYCNDFAYTNALKLFGKTTLDELYPDFQNYISPIIPTATPYNFDAIKPDSTPIQFYNTAAEGFAGVPSKPDYTVGSNNWAVGGGKTESGYPILCGDPHLRLSLPSIWYQIQLTCKGKTVSGASLPGAPGVVIGFNDSCAWSMTNAERDVKNYYHIKFKDASQQEYWLDNQWKKTEIKVETILVRGKGNVLDTVCYTAFGPVLYDQHFKLNNKTENLAVHWMSHIASNELLTIYLLNRCNNFADYDKAISYYQSPAQNFVFACKNKDIAIWQQGRFAVLKENEGKFLMEGNNSNNVPKNFIPHEQNPHILNPEQGFVSSANQQPTDDSYPYIYYGDYYEYRSLRINARLAAEQKANINSMMDLQNDSYNLWVEDFNDAIEKRIGIQHFINQTKDKLFAKKMFDWNRINTAENESTTFYNLWYDAFTAAVFNDEFQSHKCKLELPNRDVVIYIMHSDSVFQFYDNIATKNKSETLIDNLLASWDSAYFQFQQLKKENKTGWATYRNTGIAHLAKIEPFSQHTFGNGERNSINAVSSTHGPSWRMIVSLTPQTEAYGIYPGGQSGNPGSIYYDNFTKLWEKGNYNKIEVLNEKSKAIQQFVFLP